MKKIIFAFLISLFMLNPVLGMEQNGVSQNFSKDQFVKITQTLEGLSKRMEKLEGLDKSKVVSEKTKLQKIFSTLGVVPEKAAQLATYVYSNLDKKGMLKMLCILTPLFAIYCTFFPPQFLNKIAEWFGYWFVKSGVRLGGGLAEGADKALQEEFENKASMLSDAVGDLAAGAAGSIWRWIFWHPIRAAEIGALVCAPQIFTTALWYVQLKLGLRKPLTT
jgi:hypothetical protein